MLDRGSGMVYRSIRRRERLDRAHLYGRTAVSYLRPPKLEGREPDARGEPTRTGPTTSAGCSRPGSARRTPRRCRVAARRCGCPEVLRIGRRPAARRPATGAPGAPYPYCMASKRQIFVGGVPIGGGAPVAVQTMTKTETANLAATMEQIRKVADAGRRPGPRRRAARRGRRGAEDDRRANRRSR